VTYNWPAPLSLANRVRWVMQCSYMFLSTIAINLQSIMSQGHGVYLEAIGEGSQDGLLMLVVVDWC